MKGMRKQNKFRRKGQALKPENPRKSTGNQKERMQSQQKINDVKKLGMLDQETMRNNVVKADCKVDVVDTKELKTKQKLKKFKMTIYWL